MTARRIVAGAIMFAAMVYAMKARENEQAS